MLQYEGHRGRTDSAGTKEKTSGEYTSGCLIALLVVTALLLTATLDWFWGDATWHWAAEAWPGGAYAFAVCVGVAGPCLVTLSVLSLGNLKVQSWKQHRVRTLAKAGLSMASAASLVPYVALVFNTQGTGKWGRGRSTPPSWTFSHYPRLWAVGLLSTVATIGLLVWFFVARGRRRGPTETVAA